MSQGFLLDKIFKDHPELRQEYASTFNEINDHNVKLNEYKTKLDDFHKNNKTTPPEVKITTKEQGDLLENYITEIVKSSKLFEILLNVRTTGNEIDLLLRLTEEGKILRKEQVVPAWIKDYILIECKNYTDNIGITYVNKFHSLMSLTGSKLGLFISYQGLTGQDKSGWQDAHGFIRKLTLINSKCEEEPLVLDINNKQLSLFNDSDLSFTNWLDQIRRNQIFDIKIIEPELTDKEIKNLHEIKSKILESKQQ